jgi:DNA-binding transcriptional LysR family regulator
MGCTVSRTIATTDLLNVALFVPVAEERSFRKAARRLGRSASSLSDAVRSLEAAIGASLLTRTTRSVTVTDAGRELLARARPALQELASAFDELRSTDGQRVGTLRLNVPTIVARTFLPALATRFMQQHPGIRLEVVAQDEFIDVLGAGYDAGVRYEESLARDLVALPLGPRRQHFTACAAPGYLQVNGQPCHPDELTRHELIQHRFASGAVAVWEFQRCGRTIKVQPDGRIVSSNLEMELAAARAGLGILYAFDELVREDIQRGVLVPLLSDWSISFTGPKLYYARRQVSPALRCFIEFLKSSAA